MNKKIAQAYTEVLEIIKYFPEDEFLKIPREKREFYKNNMDKEYKFEIDPMIDLEKQNISSEAKAIIVDLYQKHFATEEENKEINKILLINFEEEEQLKREKYSVDNIFKSKKNVNIESKNESFEQFSNSTSLIKKDESFWDKFKNFNLKMLHFNK